MSSENELKEGNIQQPEENEGSGEIEGYSYCNSHKARWLFFQNLIIAIKEQ